MDIPVELVAGKQAVELGLLALPGVVGVGLGMREEGGEVFDELAVRILVEDSSQVPFGLPGDIAGIAVSIVESRIEPCAFPDLARYDDLMGGVRVVQPLRGAGTLAVLVQDNGTGGAVGLSCQHVVGDPGQQFPDTIWQPREPNLVAPIPTDDNIGAVIRSDFPQTQPLPFSPVVVGMTDSAVLDLGAAVSTTGVPPRTLSAAVADQGPGLPPLVAAVTATSAPEAGITRVRKRGFVTGVTAGLVIGRHLTVQWTLGGPRAFLMEQAEVLGDGVFCDTGDSGSLVLEETRPTAVGLLWGRSEATRFRAAGRIGVMSEIGNVETALGISVVLP